MQKQITVVEGDIPESLFSAFARVKHVAVDIETSGLDWSKDRIATVQIFFPPTDVVILRIDEEARPLLLCTLLENGEISKILHHAMFDLRFLVKKYGVHLENIKCTKIASKIASPSAESHRLQSLLREYLNIDIPKELAKSDWFSKELSAEQLEYASNDVAFLPELLDSLMFNLKKRGLQQLADESFRYIPTRVLLDLNGSRDVFTY